jgi:hypothetical protein
MPLIRITDTHGRPTVIESSDMETISRWLWETVNTVNPTPVCPARIEIFAIGRPDGSLDWPAMIAPFYAQFGGETPAANIRGLITALEQYTKMAEGS